MRIGILTISDRVSRGVMEDTGGHAVEEELSPDWTVARRAVVPDEVAEIARTLTEWSDGDRLDVIITTGGTGLGPRDVTPEATLSVADRTVPGIAETIRMQSMAQTPMSMISRGLAVTRGTTLIVNVPGSPRGAGEATRVVVPVLRHAVAIMHGGRHD